MLKDMEKGQEDDFDPFAKQRIPTVAVLAGVPGARLPPT